MVFAMCCFSNEMYNELLFCEPLKVDACDWTEKGICIKNSETASLWNSFIASFTGKLLQQRIEESKINKLLQDVN